MQCGRVKPVAGRLQQTFVLDLKLDRPSPSRLVPNAESLADAAPVGEGGVVFQQELVQ